MSIRLRLLFLCSFVGVLWWWWYAEWMRTEGREQHLANLEHSLVDLAQVCAGTINPAWLQHSDQLSAWWRKIIDQPAISANIYDVRRDAMATHCYVVDATGAVVFHSLHPDRVGHNFSRWNDVLLAKQGRYGARSTRLDENDPFTSVLHVAAPIWHNDQFVGSVTAFKSVQTLQPFMEKWHQQLIYAAAAIVSLVVACNWLLSLWITRPLAQLCSYADTVAAGHRLPPPHVHGPESRQLRDALLHLIDTIDGKHYVERYVHDFTHAMKGPLAGVRSSLEVLAEDLSAQQRQHFTANANQEIARTQRLLDDCLQLAVYENSEPTLADTDLVALVRTASENWHGRRPDLQFRASGDEKWMTAVDAQRLEHALDAIIENATRFHCGSSPILLMTDRTTGTIAIEDAGPGIPDYALPRLGERFYSIPPPDAAPRKGSGLGLALVQAVAQAHGATLSIRNIAPTGCRVELRFPVS